MWKRILGVVLGAWLLVVGVRPALACGEWSMRDTQKGMNVSWLINAGAVFKNEKRRGSIYLDESKSGLRVVKGKKVVFDVKAGVLRRYKKKVGQIADDGSIVIKKKTYTLEFTNPHDYHGITAWDLVVKLGDKVVIESNEATALCAVAAAQADGKALPEADQQHEVRLRVAYYLAWRDLGA